MLLPYTGLWADLIEFPDGGNVIVTSGNCTLIEGWNDVKLLPIDKDRYDECEAAIHGWEIGIDFNQSFYILNNGP